MKEYGQKGPVFPVECSADKEGEDDEDEVKVGEYVGEENLKDAFAYFDVSCVGKAVFYPVSDFCA